MLATHSCTVQKSFGVKSLVSLDFPIAVVGLMLIYMCVCVCVCVYG